MRPDDAVAIMLRESTPEEADLVSLRQRNQYIERWPHLNLVASRAYRSIQAQNSEAIRAIPRNMTK